MEDLEEFQQPQASFGGLGIPFQAVAVVGSPVFPNSIKWSQDNLLAIASGHLVTILNPAELTGPKGFVPVTQSPIFDIGKVQPADFHDPELMQFRLAREGRIGVRSIDWSPQGVASHGGCLLAVCTTDSRVKLYREPFCDYTPEWVEVGDVTELMHSCCVDNKFQRATAAYDVVTKDDRIDENKLPLKSKKLRAQSQEPQHRKALRIEKITQNTSESKDNADGDCLTLIQAKKRAKRNPLTTPPSSKNVSTRVEENTVQESSTSVSPSGQHSGSSHRSSFITPKEYTERNYSLSPLVIAWSPTCYVNDRGLVFCAVGTKAGSIWLLRVALPEYYSVEISVFPKMSLLGEIVAHKSWLTTLSWGTRSCIKDTNEDTVVLATGSSDGSVKLWSGNLGVLATMPSGSRTFPLTLLTEVITADNVIVSSLALRVSNAHSSMSLLALGKGSGQVSVCEFDPSWVCTHRVKQTMAHDQVVTGLIWTIDGRFLYSCSQDNVLHAWEFSGGGLCSLPITDCSSLLETETPQIALDLPASVLDLYHGIAFSPGMLSMAVVRGVTADMVDQMYQARAQKGVVHLFWMGCQKSKPSLDDVLDTSFGMPFHRGIQSNDFQNWRTKILFALHQMEDPTLPLVLWDIIAALTNLKPVTSAEFVISIILQWISSWCQGLDLGDTGTLYAYLDSLLANLASASCRQLQIMCVLYRQLLLANCTAEVLSGRTSQEQLEPSGERIPSWGKISGLFLHSAEQEEQLKKHLRSVEYELRQRLYIGTLSLASCLETAEQLENRLGDMEVVLPLVVNWVTANKSNCFPRLVQLADEISSSSNDMSSLLTGKNLSEHCSFCDADVRLESPEVAYCCGHQSEKGISKHKLQRCSVSLQLCPGTPLWYCNCCARWASALAPASFFHLPSRTVLEHAVSPIIQQTPLPACPFCGILMHRYLPDFLLSPKLV